MTKTKDIDIAADLEKDADALRRPDMEFYTNGDVVTNVPPPDKRDEPPTKKK